ncbi:MAG TPA: GntR family transcriptional regulator, partial [Gammaproteobacteria bacterium]
GTRLDEASLAARFGVSRTPVREALNQLVSSGLVELRPRRGATVAAPGLKQLLEMFEVMAELEGLCGRLAARRMSEEERDLLQAAHDGSQVHVDHGDSDGYYEANVAFHEAIYAGCHNRFLAEQTRALRNRLAPYRRLQLRRVDRIAESNDEHAAVLRAIVDGDANEADRLLQSHVTVQGGSFADFVASLPVAQGARAAG